jgi:hypothetical protein
MVIIYTGTKIIMEQSRAEQSRAEQSRAEQKKDCHFAITVCELIQYDNTFHHVMKTTKTTKT